MARDRLSRLQKWILKTAYKHDGFIFRPVIYMMYFKHSAYHYHWRRREALKKEEWYKKRKSHRVILCRSLKALKEKNLVRIDWAWPRRLVKISLTDEGKKKALMLISGKR